ncbi:MAG: hypothetical protein JXR53_06720 [Bacteroidales bacterium]|nr:hypothetical protein [Bacteroidales bacterium]
MKPIKRLYITSCVLLIVILSSCVNPEEEYFDVTEEYKSACLYYSDNVGDTIVLCKDTSDTLHFIVNEKKFYYLNHVYDSHRHYQIYELYFANIGFQPQYFSVTMQVDDSTPELYISFDDFVIFGILEISNYSDTISGIYYTDLYKIRHQAVPSKYIITSRSQGIIYAQNDTVQYVRVY